MKRDRRNCHNRRKRAELGIAKSTAEERGFAIIPDIFRADEMDALLNGLSVFEGQRSRAGVRHLMGHPTIRELAHDQRLLGLAQSILGPDAFPFRATLFDKSPDANWLITWHQDTALPLREKHEAPGWGPWSVKEGVIYAHAPAQALERVVALRLHLDDSTEENGPLRVVPRTHSKGVLSDAEVEEIVAANNPVSCMVGRGGVIVMRPLIVHASSKSQAEISRRVLHIEYAANPLIPNGPHLAIA